MKSLVIFNQDNGEKVFCYNEKMEPEVSEHGHYFTVFYVYEDEDGEKESVSCDYMSKDYYYQWNYDPEECIGWLKELSDRIQLGSGSYNEEYQEQADNELEALEWAVNTLSNTVQKQLVELQVYDCGKIIPLYLHINKTTDPVDVIDMAKKLATDKGIRCRLSNIPDEIWAEAGAEKVYIPTIEMVEMSIEKK